MAIMLLIYKHISTYHAIDENRVGSSKFFTFAWDDPSTGLPSGTVETVTIQYVRFHYVIAQGTDDVGPTTVAIANGGLSTTVPCNCFNTARCIWFIIRLPILSWQVYIPSSTFSHAQTTLKWDNGIQVRDFTAMSVTGYNDGYIASAQVTLDGTESPATPVTWTLETDVHNSANSVIWSQIDGTSSNPLQATTA